MAAKLPDGAIVSLYVSYDSPESIDDISNDLTPIAICPNSFAINDVLIIKSGWSALNDRVVVVTAATGTSFTFKGVDTTDTNAFPIGAGYGEAIKIASPETITQIMGFSTNGGEQQFVTYSYLEQNFESQMPTVFSAQSLSLEIADDTTLAGYKALKTAADARATRALKFALPDGSAIYYNGYISLQESPTVTKGELMMVKATVSLLARPTRL
jgi:hypothetical protein